ncbi:hypothetical protein EGD84_20935 [Salmonella enterica]|nr:hypothetical protein [Salmonella enterica]
MGDVKAGILIRKYGHGFCGCIIRNKTNVGNHRHNAGLSVEPADAVLTGLMLQEPRKKKDKTRRA